MEQKLTGSEIRQSFFDYFIEQKHTLVPSASLVPGGDATLLFTNAGMVQFKDVFLGTDKRPYSRAVNSQKCMRVAGKHNDLEDVGRDDYHHTFFEMLGNWSFGDYYKTEAIAWAWQLLTEVWGLPKDRIFATCFKDDKGSIPTDNEAADEWRKQPGFDKSHLLFFGRKENFWEMAETGPCGPCSEIHIDRGEEFDNLAGKPHRCGVNGECQRYLELWNNVFIQYNRTGPETLEPLPATHVDTGMGFERIVAVIQGVDSNYKTDLFAGLLASLSKLTGVSLEEMYANFTPYRVIADHARAAVFLIADGVVPGNVGRNYICRMIIRRAARFGLKIGLTDPFLAKPADEVISAYQDFFPELKKHRDNILDSITREEVRFARTVETGIAQLLGLLEELKKSNKNKLDGRKAFDLYSTYGLPFEIARDIAHEQGQEVEEVGFTFAMDEHRVASGAGKAMGKMDGKDVDLFSRLVDDLREENKLGKNGVVSDPYTLEPVDGQVLAMVMDGQNNFEVGTGDVVEVLLPRTGFYIESGGQVSDTGIIRASAQTPDGKPEWEIDITELKKPAPGTIVHIGEVVFGHPRVGDEAVAIVDKIRRHDIMRNHTATHLLHAALEKTLGNSARQAGSLVAADHLRFDFSYPEALTEEQLLKVEKLVNEAIYSNMHVIPLEKGREEAIEEGATALFGEKYGDTVRTITIASVDNNQQKSIHSYELCGGTHLDNTSAIGIFLIRSESSTAAGIRRIEAVTGRGAYKEVAQRIYDIKKISRMLSVAESEIPMRVAGIQDELAGLRKRAVELEETLAIKKFNEELTCTSNVKGIHLLRLEMPGISKDILAKLADIFREKFPQEAICIIASEEDGNITIMAAVTKDLIYRGIKAGDLVGLISRLLGAGGGGAPHLAFGGGKDISKLPEAFLEVEAWVESKLL